MADRTILHSDINCCYASIELLHHPELRGKPVAVGGSYLSTAYLITLDIGTDWMIFHWMIPKQGRASCSRQIILRRNVE